MTDYLLNEQIAIELFQGGLFKLLDAFALVYGHAGKPLHVEKKIVAQLLRLGLLPKQICGS